MSKRRVNWEELSFDVGWGVLRGKTCVVGGGGGCGEGLKILALHGWLDNANTFDTLVPLLPVGVTVVSLDLPGNGLSDHLPRGALYSEMTHVLNIRSVVEILGWQKFVFLAHSFGCFMVNYYTAMFPETVTAVVNIDYVIPRQLAETECMLSTWRKDSDIIADAEKSARKPYPVYSWEEAILRLVNARRTGPNKDQPNIDKEAAGILLERSARRVDGGYTWNHDRRVYARFIKLYGKDNWLYIISRVKCPVLLIRASKDMYGHIPGIEAYYKEVLETYESSSKHFTYSLVDGPHHVHLTHPERVASSVAQFLTWVASQDQRKAKL